MAKPKEKVEPAELVRGGAAPEPRRFRIETPVAGFKGRLYGIEFAGGVGRTDDETKARQCRELGHRVVEEA